MTKTRNKLKLTGLLLSIVILVALLGAMAIPASAAESVAAWKDTDNDGVVDSGEATYTKLSTAIAAGGTIKLNGDYYYSDNDGYYMSMSSGTTVLDLNGYKLSFGYWDKRDIIVLSGTADLTITDSKTTGVMGCENRSDVQLSDSAKLTIAGGTIKTAAAYSQYYLFINKSDNAVFEITGGTHYSIPNAHVADGYKVTVSDSDPRYTVSKIEMNEVVAWNDADNDGIIDSGERVFSDMDNALAADVDLKMNSDIFRDSQSFPPGSLTISSTKTIDLNGYSIAASAYCFEVAGGTLTIKDSAGGGQLWCQNADSFAAIMIYAGDDLGLVVESGTILGDILKYDYFNAPDTVVLKGGNYDFDPSKYIKDSTLAAGQDPSGLWSIRPAAENACFVTIGGEYYYTGEAITPTIVVTEFSSGKVLTEGTDYTVSLSDNVNAGTATVTVTFINDYRGSITETFTIAKATPVVTPPQAKDIIYNGEAQELVIAGATDRGTLLYSTTENGEFTEAIPTKANVGTYTVYYYAKGDDNTGDSEVASVTVTIAPMPITRDMITVHDVVYTGSEQLPKVTVVVNGKELVEGIDFTVIVNTTHLLYTTAGSYPVTIIGRDNYTGHEEMTFVIHKAPLVETVSPKGLTDLVYTGEAHQLVTEGSAEGCVCVYSLTPDGEYTTTVPTGTDAGEYTVYYRYEGNRNYEGSVTPGTILVSIAQKPVTDEIATVTLEENTVIYDGTPKQPAVLSVLVDGVALVEGVDYTLSYQNNTNLGKATVVVTFEGNFKGIVEQTFEIVCYHEALFYADNGDGTHTPVCPSCPTVFDAEEHTHTHAYTDNGDGTHTPLCVCENKADPVTHSYRYTDNGNGTHTPYCHFCNSEKADETHVFEDGYCTSCETPKPYGVELSYDTGVAFVGSPVALHGCELTVELKNTVSAALTKIHFIGFYINGEYYYEGNCDMTFVDNILTIPAELITGDVKIYAYAEVLVTVKLNGGKLTEQGEKDLDFKGVWDAENDTWTVHYWTTVNEDVPAWFARDGYTLAGVQIGGVAFEDKVKILTDQIWEVQWTPNQYTVTWNVDGVTTTTQQTFDKTLILPEAIPTKENYTFVGWFTAPEKGTMVDATTVFQNANDDTVYYAVFAPNAKISGASVAVGKDLTMRYYVSLTDKITGELAMRFTMNGESLTVTEYTIVDGEYVFAFNGIAPQCMSDNIKAELLLDGVVIGSKEEYSVKANAEALLAKHGDDEALVQLITDLLTYGAAAQSYREHNTENLANANVAGLGTPSVATPDKTDLELSESKSDTLYFTGANVWFDSMNKIGVTLSTIENATLKVNGVAVELTNATYYTEGVSTTRFDEVYVFELYENGELVQTLRYSVNSYAFSMQNSENQSMKDLALALYRYGVSAKVYDHVKTGRGDHFYVDNVCACGKIENIDATAMTADELKTAMADQLAAGETDITVTLKPDAPAEMITAIRRAICDTEGIADGSINLTLKGVTTIPGTTNWDGVAFGPGDIYDEAGEIVDQELVTQLASINLPDVTEIGAQAFYFCENLVSVSAPKAQTIGAQALGYTALTSVEFPELTTIPTDMFSGTWTLSSAKFPKVTTVEQGGLLVGAKFTPENNPTPFPLELTAEGDITFNGSYHFNIAERNYTGKVDLVLNIDKKDQVTFHDDGTATWQVRDDLSYTFKSITFVGE